VVNKAALGQVFPSEYFGFPCQLLHRLLHNHHLPSSGAGTGQTVAHVPSGPNVTPPEETNLRSGPITADFGVNTKQSETSIHRFRKYSFTGSTVLPEVQFYRKYSFTGSTVLPEVQFYRKYSFTGSIVQFLWSFNKSYFI
jgi:hypothetical protein